MRAKQVVARLLAQVVSRVLPKAVFSKDNFEVWQAAGFHVVPNHFYEPIPDTRRLPESLWSRPPESFAFQFNQEAQQSLLQGFSEKWLQEWTELLDAENPINGRPLRHADSFGSGDREALYGLVRHLKPARILEIGSGATTAVSARALERNRMEGHPGELIAVEPFPAERLRQGFPGLTRLEVVTAQEIPRTWISALRPNDILFIDSSHVYKAGSDVQHIFAELMAAVPHGVYVHFHDIFLPDEYPRAWIRDLRIFWNEQYILEAFLSFNAEFEVVWSSALMATTRAEFMRKAIPWMEPLPHCPGSFWIRRR